MKLADYKVMLRGQEKELSRLANLQPPDYGRYAATGILNRSLRSMGIDVSRFCTNEGTANAVLSWCDRKAGR